MALQVTASFPLSLLRAEPRLWNRTTLPAFVMGIATLGGNRGYPPCFTAVLSSSRGFNYDFFFFRFFNDNLFVPVRRYAAVAINEVKARELDFKERCVTSRQMACRFLFCFCF